MGRSHHSSGMIVVQIDLGLNITRFFATVQEELGVLHTEVHVVGTAAPFPATGDLGALVFLLLLRRENLVCLQVLEKLLLLLIQRLAEVLVEGFPIDGRIAAAGHQTALAAGPGHTVGHPGGRNGKGECALPVP